MSTPKVSAVDDLLAGFVEDRERIGEVVELALAEFDREQPEIWSDPELRELGARAIAAAISQFAAVMRGGLSLEEFALAPANAELAIAQARRGVTIEQALYSSGLAQAASWDVWLREVRASETDPVVRGEAIAHVAKAMLRVHNALCQQISQVHAAERERWLRGRAARQARAVMGLLAGADASASSQLSEELGYELRGEHRATVVWSASEEAGVSADLLSSVAREIVGGGGLVVEVEAHAAWAWGARARTAREDTLPPGVRAAAGGAHVGVGGFRRSHREAQLARRVAEAMPAAPRALAYDEVAMLALAAQDIDAARGFVDSVLGPLRDAGPRGQRLARTVQVYLEEQASPRRASHRLDLHENTVIKHVRAAEELLGRSVEERHPEMLVALILASSFGLLAHAPSGRP